MSASKKSVIKKIEYADNAAHLLKKLGVPAKAFTGGTWKVSTPIDGSEIGRVTLDTPKTLEAKIARAHKAFLAWRTVPAPRRGELIRLYGEILRANKDDLGKLVTLECGKILTEGLGEVQEMIDICDFSVGLSRQLYGLTIASERPQHKMQENWHPAGVVGVISAFNFPIAVWCWNFALAVVCGDSVVWKPSEKTPLCAIACQQILQNAIQQVLAPSAISSVVIGGAAVGQALAASPQLPLISATGSVPMGQAVAKTVAARLGRTLLELGGNNGMIVAPSADLRMAIRSIVFAAAGTCGQRCTTLRRLIVHDSIADELRDRILAVYQRLVIGDPTQEGVLVGPLIDKRAFEATEAALAAVRQQGGQVHGGGRVTDGVPAGGYYVRPALVEMGADAPIVQQETFAPILYFMRYSELEEAIRIHNGVPQGLSSAILTRDVQEAERFTSAAGSDCGIANVNVGTSGAEIGGAFGGEKETGGGRESGSDSWKAYMRRVTSTVNYSDDLPLAQGIKFDL